jgi:hypothetical protein
MIGCGFIFIVFSLSKSKQARSNPNSALPAISPHVIRRHVAPSLPPKRMPRESIEQSSLLVEAKFATCHELTATMRYGISSRISMIAVFEPSLLSEDNIIMAIK